MAWPLRAVAALLSLSVALLLACTSSGPAPVADVSAAGSAVSAAPATAPSASEGAAPAAPAPAPSAAASAAPAAPAPPAAAPEGLPGTEALEPPDPHVRVAVETVNDLFLGRYDAVTARLEIPLRERLSPAALRSLVDGVVAAHGQPDRVMDAWAGRIEEKGLVWPTASVLLRMSRSPTRFLLLLVFNPDESVRGLWLRPL